MEAITSVGSVRTMFSSTRSTVTTNPFLTILAEAVTANGSASTEPMTEPSTDILMVSSSGLITLGRYSHLGLKICSRMTLN